ncbi:hypothetical protein E8E14_009679 [Neopestalotiopsis sp. 37M]|nr:hypothetical protein E8E14_009679 [Neopestalotiopsis sp. 37M]
MTGLMCTWKSAVSEVKSRCGFCGETFSLWSDRNDHLSDHFKAGRLMKDWKGCRGLEPAIALLVENAIPPYLIGMETQDADPFSASKGNTKTGFAMGDNSLAPTAFGALTAGLGEYVRTAKTAGDDITDDALRRQARLILYGDDDPWNQTPADNSQWLEMFKAGYGLDHDPFQQQSTTACASNTYSASTQPTTSSGPFSAQSPSPFTAETVQHAVGFDPTIMQFELNYAVAPPSSDDLVSAATEPAFTIPWSWQTPECLAEFRQLGLLPSIMPTATACDPVIDETSGLANTSCIRTDQTVENPIFAAPVQASTSGAGQIPSQYPPQDTLFAFDADFDFE